MPKPKNIIIFIAIGLFLFSIYFFFIRKPADTAPLVSTTAPEGSLFPDGTVAEPAIAQDFLNLLLNVQTIKLDDSIFSDIAFTSLRDSSITLIPDGTEGRPNPFAPIGIDIMATPIEMLDQDMPIGAPTPTTPPMTGTGTTGTPKP